MMICIFPKNIALTSNHDGANKVGSMYPIKPTLADAQSHCKIAMAVTTTSWLGMLHLCNCGFFGKT